jgi:hypothetical protein
MMDELRRLHYCYTVGFACMAVHYCVQRCDVSFLSDLLGLRSVHIALSSARIIKEVEIVQRWRAECH